MPEPRKTNRRDFLKGRSAANAVSELIDGLADAPSLPPLNQRQSGYQLHLSRRAMACDFEVFLNAGQYAHGTQAAIEALDLVEDLEAQMTVYRDQSEVSDMNRRAFEEPVEVEPRLFALFEYALELHAETGGAFDIASGVLTKTWGFFQRAGRVPGDDELAEAMQRTGSQHVQLDPARQTIRFTRPGIELNLGSIGKGYALDRCRELLLEQDVHDFFWHGGQSSVLAWGSDSVEPGDDPGWTVGVRHPIWPDRRLAEIRLRDQALGTSGSEVQFFREGGRRYGHVLDPRSGRPAEGVMSATVVAPRAATADALATAYYVLGPEAALKHCRQHADEGLACVLVTRGRGPGDVLLHAEGFSPGQLRMAVAR